ncbi:MAG: hypothetical protein ACLRWF_07720 [Ruthenibacterium sp.]
MSKLKLMTIVGTRPEIIRLSAVIKSATYTLTSFWCTRAELRLHAEPDFFEDLACARRIIT